MTGPEFHAALTELHIEQQQFADCFGIWPGTVSRWVRGHRAVPSWVPVVLELLELLREHSSPR